MPVEALSLNQFYGTELPRPVIFTPPNGQMRVDPPEGINSVFLEWAADASWNMGGLDTKKRRVVGRIEGSVAKLRHMSERETKKRAREEKAARKARRAAGGSRLAKKVKESESALDLEELEDDVSDEEEVNEYMKAQKHKLEVESEEEDEEEEDEEEEQVDEEEESEQEDVKSTRADIKKKVLRVLRTVRKQQSLRAELAKDKRRKQQKRR